MDKNAVIGCGKKKNKDDQLELILTTHLYKDFAPLLDDVGLVFQVVFGGLTDVYLHALLRQNRTQKTDAKAKYLKKKKRQLRLCCCLFKSRTGMWKHLSHWTL